MENCLDLLRFSQSIDLPSAERPWTSFSNYYFILFGLEDSHH
jgi:hypothetical protein